MVTQERGADGDGHVHVAGEIEVADGAAVDAAVGRFQLVDDFDCARLRSARQRAGRERGLEHIECSQRGVDLAGDRRADVHDVAETLDVHELHDFHGLRHAHLTQVVARQVDEHDVLAAFLRIGKQLLGEFLVFLRGGAARAGSSNREGHRVAVVHLDEGFRAGANHVEVAALSVGQRHEIHVRARVQRAQHTVHVERVSRRIDVEALGDDHLEHVAVDDVLLGAFDGLLVVALLGAKAQLGLGDRFVQDVDAGLVRSRGGGIALHLVESSDGLVVGGVGASGFIIHIHRIGDEPYRTGYVVDHGDIGGQGKHGLRLSGLVRSFGAQGRFPVADGIPADRADQTAGQVRQAFHMRGLQSLQRGVSDFDHVTGDGHADRDLAQPVGLTVVGAQLGHRVDADEAVTAPRAAVFRRFEDEGAGSAAGETLVEADRGERVGEQTAHDRNHTVAGVGQFVELFATGPGGAPLQVFDAAFAHIRSFTYKLDVLLHGTRSLGFPQSGKPVLLLGRAMAFDHGQGAAFEEAATLAGVACGADLVDFDEQCVAVAIQGHALDVLHMAGGITLAPVFLTGPGPEGHAAGGQRAA